MPGSRSTTAGVIALPTATPSTVRMTSPTAGTLASGAPASASARHAKRGPSRNGSGRSSARNAATPTAAAARVRSLARSTRGLRGEARHAVATVEDAPRELVGGAAAEVRRASSLPRAVPITDVRTAADEGARARGRAGAGGRRLEPTRRTEAGRGRVRSGAAAVHRGVERGRCFLRVVEGSRGARARGRSRPWGATSPTGVRGSSQRAPWGHRPRARARPRRGRGRRARRPDHMAPGSRRPTPSRKGALPPVVGALKDAFSRWAARLRRARRAGWRARVPGLRRPAAYAPRPRAAWTAWDVGSR